jgi:hypothetical protein
MGHVMTEPRFFGDVYPPDDPRLGDVWLANGVRRVWLGDGWEPPGPGPGPGPEPTAATWTVYDDMLRVTRRRAGLKASATRERRKADIPVDQ